MHATQTGSSRNRPRNSYGRFWRILIHIALLGLSLAFLLPLMLVIAGSVSDEQSVIAHGYRLIPEKFSLFAFDFVLKDPGPIISGYRVTTTVTVVGTLISLFIMALMAYAISRREFKFRHLISFIVYFTMLFSGGLIPYYILMVRVLDLKDTMWALILPGLVTPFYVLILRSYFDGLPQELLDAARIDGASEWRIFFSIALPLSTPVLVTIGMLTVISYWNDWFNALLFIDTPRLHPLQLLLYRLMQNLAFLTQNMKNLPPGTKLPPIPTSTIRMTLAVLGTVPPVIVFLFLQKYFVGGLTIGALKGGGDE